MKTAKLITMGCKVNQYDTQSMREALVQNGYEIVDDEHHADLYLINTCTVTNVADQKARQTIRRAIRHNPNADVLVTGCYAESDRKTIESIPGVTFVFGNREKAEFQSYLDKLTSDTPIQIQPIQHDAIREHARFSSGVSNAGNKTRAFIKVQDGCSAFCTYCIIPYVRGRMTSRSLTDIVEETNRIAESGIKEIVITGVHLGAYGQDTGRDKNIADILENIHEINGIERIRFSSIEPMYFPDILSERMSVLPKCMPHFHLPIQSGSDSVLRRMRRKYSTIEFSHLIDTLRQRFTDDVGLTTDIMVGFPGETDTEFKDSLQYVKDIGFSQLHVFRYSPRKGTPAATYPDQVTPSVSVERSKEMIALGEDLSRSFRQKMIGKLKEVLIEDSREGENNQLAGFTDNYIRVLINGPDNAVNEVLPIKLTSISNEYLFGKCA
ncbi:tRNA (N(6)-L-threonylcarbamoyladenosine(37)-C(2))-methylthiotransferase MtaB [Candidatus Poribacteria bacterium]|nr:tRNA (N(6)-L-threonylcarbamoyladenosine(37)-C(2))-methylthiotransferase MtaB [Candidatus Poribacteria bacterium]